MSNNDYFLATSPAVQQAFASTLAIVNMTRLERLQLATLLRVRRDKMAKPDDDDYGFERGVLAGVEHAVRDAEISITEIRQQMRTMD
jgi:hypothetical protein